MQIKKTISEWAKNTLSITSCGFEAIIVDLPAAPPFLFTGNSGSGYCVTIKPSPSFLLHTSSFEAPSLGFWIPESGAQGSQCTMREWDVEISTFAVDWLHATRTDAATGEQTALANEDALSDNLSTLFSEFLRDEVLLPTLEKYLNDNDIAHEAFFMDMCGGIEPWDEKNWTFLFLPAEPIISSEEDSQPDWSTSRVLGLTGDGRAACFQYSRHEVQPTGYVDHISLESQATGIDSPAALRNWVKDSLSAFVPVQLLEN